MKRDGFSLLELLICMALMMVLFVMANSFGSKSYQDRQKIACEKNLQTIHVALKIYAMENKSAFPYLPGAVSSEAPLSALVPRYTSVTGIFICPGSKDKALPEAKPFANRKISYAYAMGLTTQGDAR